jgi:hypothetical protein
MGTWGAGIFDNDAASDVRLDFEDAQRAGFSVSESTQQILRVREDEGALDYDEGPLIYLALAALQMDHGELAASIKAHALAAIDAESETVDEWFGPEIQAARRQVLEALRQRLLSYPASAAGAAVTK